MFYGIIWVVATGLVWASISAVMSQVAHHQVPKFLFYSISASITAVMSWIILVDWSAAAQLPRSYLLTAVPCFMLPGFVNVLSQTAMIKSLQLGHNGLSIAIRNCAGVIPFTVGLIFLNNQVSWLNWVGLIFITAGLIVITLGKKKPDASEKQPFTVKWLIVALLSMILSGTFQTLNTVSADKFNEIVKAGMATPLVMSCCASGYFSLFLIRERKHLPPGSFSGKIWRFAIIWSVLALLSYFFMFKSLDAMRKVNAAALVFPVMMGINVSCFSIYSKLKLREPYSLVNICCLLLCLTGVILLCLR